MNVKVGSAPDSWGVWFAADPRQTPWERFLDEVAEAGYEWIELGPYGYLPTDLKVLKDELGRRGLKVSGGCALSPPRPRGGAREMRLSRNKIVNNFLRLSLDN